MTKHWYELRIVYSRETPFENKRPEKIIIFNSKDECYNFLNNNTNFSDHLYLEIYYKNDNGYNIYHRLIQRIENKPERFSREIWENFAKSKNMTSGIVCVIGDSIYHLKMDEKQMINVLCTVGDLKTCMIKGKSKMIISDNSNNFCKIMEYLKNKS